MLSFMATFDVHPQPPDLTLSTYSAPSHAHTPPYALLPCAGGAFMDFCNRCMLIDRTLSREQVWTRAVIRARVCVQTRALI